MPSSSPNPLAERFLAAADAVALHRPEVDLDLARELMLEAATMLHDGLALDGIDARDVDAVVDGVATALVDPDPGAALRSRAHEIAQAPGDLFDPEAAAAAYLTTAQTLGV